MFDPMIARLTGCLVFAGLMGALLTAVSAHDVARKDMVAAAEINQRVASVLLARR